MKKESIIILTCLLLYIFSLSVHAAPGGLMIAPSVIQKQIEANEKYFGSINVSNFTGKELTLIAFARNWRVNARNKMELTDETSKMSLTESIRFNPKQFTLKPGEKQVVRYIIRTPPQLPAGEYRNAFVFSNKDPIKASYATQTINLTYQIVSTVYLATSDINRSAEFTELKADKSGVKGTLNSTGSGSFVARGSYQLLNTTGKCVKKDIIKEKLVVLPGDSRTFNFTLGADDIEPGNYRLRVVWEHIPADYLSSNDFREYAGRAATIETTEIKID